MVKLYDKGINDLRATFTVLIDGKVVKKNCPYYQKWHSMLTRCYSKKFQEKQPAYIGCSVSEEWLLFSNFKKWMEKQDWIGNELDKDLLFNGNKIYGPQTCLFVSQQVNNFMVNKGKETIGVGFHKHVKKYFARCSDLNFKRLHLGYFDTVEEASEAWKNKKRELAIELSEKQTDPRISKALIERYK